jgi:hypothetical protein
MGRPGDFASNNPRKSMWAGDSELVVGAVAVTMGRFAWANDAGVVTNAQPGSGVARLGFVATDGNQGLGALITTWLAGYGYQVLPGNGITLHVDADVLVQVTVANATRGQKAFASITDSTVQPGAAGAPISGYVETPWYFVSDATIGNVAAISVGG